MSLQPHTYDEGTYDSFLWDYEEAAAPSTNSGFVPTGSDPASLWWERKMAIETLARQRTQPRVLSGRR